MVIRRSIEWTIHDPPCGRSPSWVGPATASGCEVLVRAIPPIEHVHCLWLATDALLFESASDPANEEDRRPVKGHFRSALVLAAILTSASAQGASPAGSPLGGNVGPGIGAPSPGLAQHVGAPHAGDPQTHVHVVDNGQRRLFAGRLRKMTGTVTHPNVFVHTANFTSRATLLALGLGIPVAPVALGFLDAAIAARGAWRYVKTERQARALGSEAGASAGKSVAKTGLSIGATGAGNGGRGMGAYLFAEASFAVAGALAFGGVRSAVRSARDEAQGSDAETQRGWVGARLARGSGRTLRAFAWAVRRPHSKAGERALPRVGLAGANLFMKAALMAAAAHRPGLSAALAGTGVAIGVAPALLRSGARSPRQIVGNVKKVIRDPLTRTTVAIALTDAGIAGEQLGSRAVAAAGFTGALLFAGSGAFRAIRDHRRGERREMAHGAESQPASAAH